MKIRLLADENISWRIKRVLPNWTILPSNEMAGIKPLPDMELWKFARINDYTILTFDEDFIDIYTLHSFQPKNIMAPYG